MSATIFASLSGAGTEMIMIFLLIHQTGLKAEGMSG
jgi:hypothetical protein